MKKLLKKSPLIETYLKNQFRIAIYAKMDLFYYGEVQEDREERLKAEKENESILSKLEPLFTENPDVEKAFYKVLWKLGEAAKIVGRDIRKQKSAGIGYATFSKVISTGLQETLESIIGSEIKTNL